MAPDDRRTLPHPGLRRRASGLALLLIVVAGVLVAGAIGVRGDFPLSDDWSYATAVRTLCEEGDLRLVPWTGASLVLQAWYGALLCWWFGFSFTVLRVSTVALGTGGAIGMYLLLRGIGVDGRSATLGTVVVALNPLYLNLGFTFMTDVPCAALAIWAAYAYVRGLDERQRHLLVWGSVATTAALLIRQHAIFVAIAAALAALLAADRPLASRVRDVLAAAVLPAVAFAAFHVWLFAVEGAPGGYANKLGEAHRVSAAGLANTAFRGIEYLGLFLCPLAAGCLPSVRAHPRLIAAWSVALAGAAVALFVREGALMFYLTNVAYDLGLGALTLRDTLFLGLPPPVRVGPWLTLPLTLVATLSAVILASLWSAGLARLRSPVPAFLLFALALLFGGTLLHARYYFDRYLVLVLPFAVATTIALGPSRSMGKAREPSPSRPEHPAPETPRAWALALVASAALATYAVAGTHDYLAWNRARFALLDDLMATGIEPSAIDGGFEFNAWHLATRLDRWPSDADVRSGQPETVKSWWWVVDDRYVVAFRPLTGYAVRSEASFTCWLPPGSGRVLLLERQEGRAARADGDLRPIPSGGRDVSP